VIVYRNKAIFDFKSIISFFEDFFWKICSILLVLKTVKKSIFNLLYKLWVNDMIAITYHFFGNDIYMIVYNFLGHDIDMI
jgi:hypothetical protein